MWDVGRVRILLVEDERRLAQVLARGLGLDGFVVDVANDGRAGFLLARTGGYDAMVLDLMLPVMSGLEVCRSLRAEDVVTPILVLTARDAERDEVSVLREHRDRLLAERERLGRMAETVARTLTELEAQEGNGTMTVEHPENLFEGFDATRYEAEARERWPEQAAASRAVCGMAQRWGDGRPPVIDEGVSVADAVFDVHEFSPRRSARAVRARDVVADTVPRLIFSMRAICSSGRSQ